MNTLEVEAPEVDDEATALLEPIHLPPEPPQYVPPRLSEAVRVRLARLAIAVVVTGFVIGWAGANRSMISSGQPNVAVATGVPAQNSPAVGGQHWDVRYTPIDLNELYRYVNPVEGYIIPAAYGNIGPHLLAAGAINQAQFVELYRTSGQPLTTQELAILTQGSGDAVTINGTNSHFLLNFFWALGLTNNNRILTEGAMVNYGDVGNYASTGGWTLGSKPATALYASQSILPLTDEQQARLEEVTNGIFRPCCGNSTAFPDCNHGMAMLGIMELMASQNATVEAMFQAAKYVNAFWFPQQTLELATFFKTTQNLNFDAVDARTVVNRDFFSADGFSSVHEWLTVNSLLADLSGGGNSCAVSG